jgi:hypothetical protein
VALASGWTQTWKADSGRLQQKKLPSWIQPIALQTKPRLAVTRSRPRSLSFEMCSTLKARRIVRLDGHSCDSKAS